MSTWSPVTGLPIQYSEDASGTSASGNYLKFYKADTTTPISMATDSTGGTTLAKCALNSLGQAVNGSSAVFIPHIDQMYKAVLYPDSTTADANTFASAIWNVDGITPSGVDALISVRASGEFVKEFDTIAAAVASTTLVVGDLLSVKDRASSLWDAVLSSGVTENGYNIVQCTGVATLSLVLRNTNYPNVKEYGAVGDGVTDDTGAIRAAFEADIAVCFPTPASFYKTTSAIMIGNGNARFIIGASRYTTEIRNAVTDVFNVGGSNDATMFTMQELKVTSETGGGHCFDVKWTVSESTIENCWIKQSNTGKSLWNQTTGYGGHNVVSKCRLEAAIGATVNPWYINSNEIVNGLLFDKCVCYNSAGTKQFFYVSSTSISSFNTMCIFRDITFQRPYGGMIYLGGHQGSLIENCHSYDNETPQTGHGFYIGQSDVTKKSSRCKISRSGRSTALSSLSAGIRDIYLESAGASNTIIESCFNIPAGNKFEVDFQNNKALVIDRQAATSGTYVNDDGVTYIDINGDYEGIVAPAYHTTALIISRELTLATDIIVPTHLYHTVDTQADAATDDLVTITATNIKTGDILYLRPENTARTVVVKHGTGNIFLTGSVDFTMDNSRDVLALLYTGTEFLQVNGNNGT